MHNPAYAFNCKARVTTGFRGRGTLLFKLNLGCKSPGDLSDGFEPNELCVILLRANINTIFIQFRYFVFVVFTRFPFFFEVRFFAGLSLPFRSGIPLIQFWSIIQDNVRTLFFSDNVSFETRRTLGPIIDTTFAPRLFFLFRLAFLYVSSLLFHKW